MWEVIKTSINWAAALSVPALLIGIFAFIWMPLRWKVWLDERAKERDAKREIRRAELQAEYWAKRKAKLMAKEKKVG